MNTKQYLGLVLVVAVAGFMGGVVSSSVSISQFALADMTEPLERQSISAREFKLVDEHGKVRAKFALQDTSPRSQEWGLWLFDQEGKECSQLVTNTGNWTTLHLHTTQKSEAKLRGGGVLFETHPGGAYGQVAYGLNYIEFGERSDTTGGPSISLTSIGQVGHGTGRIVMSAAEDGAASIKIRDAKDRIRAVMGSTSTVTPTTGVEHSRPESSLVLSDQQGNVIWQAP